METKLELGEKLIIDESIEEYEYHEYIPDSGNTKLNQGGEIRIPINAEDTFLDISESYLVFEGQIVKNDGSEVADKAVQSPKEIEKTTLVNNGLMYLFSEIKYDLSGQSIEHISNPGETTSMMGLLKYSEDFEKCLGMNQLWCRERTWDARSGLDRRHNYISKQSDPKGYFSFTIPLKHLFGFTESYDKVMYGFKHQLSLYRKSDDSSAIVRRTELPTVTKFEMVDDCKIRLDKLSWYAPHVTPNLENKVKLMEQI